MRSKSRQEQFWASSFGTEYTDRNTLPPEARSPFFKAILEQMKNVRTVCELGSNRGHNLEAIKLAGKFDLTGVELNEDAHAILSKIEGVNAVLSSIQDFEPVDRFDFVFVAGVLIHINPSDLPEIYAKMASISRKYVLLSEYFNPEPVEVPYRGHQGVLFKRDFAGEFLDAHPDFQVMDYGFKWKRVEPAWDNCCWFLLERRESDDR
ncbi:MAG: methyltransferase domain-containing protein [Cyanobacteria bacterium HKST-UBA02]|nr:methyltransferase domain-containing protein [Cyanobacteria bacterium HKST-UBA02]